MYKYLKNKLKNTRSGAFIENLVFMTNEYLREKPSDTFVEFMDLEPDKICEVLGWRQEKDVYELINNHIEEKELSNLMNRNGVTGFLAQCLFPETANFRFSEGKKQPTSWSVHPNCCRIEWIYADTIGELIEKLVNMDEKLFNENFSN